ncbi:MAG: hypothetical protein AAGJ93_03710 [Bacteroidota bacterium]
MTTISILEDLKITQTQFETLEDFELYLVAIRQESELNIETQKILDQRLADRAQSPDDAMSIDELKASLRRK